MAKKRNTKLERSQARADLEIREWDKFRPRLEALGCLADAMRLVAEAPLPDSPGRKYFSNLGFFLMNFSAPMGANSLERALYLQLIRRMDAVGELKPGDREKVEKDFGAAKQFGLESTGFNPPTF